MKKIIGMVVLLAAICVLVFAETLGSSAPIAEPDGHIALLHIRHRRGSLSSRGHRFVGRRGYRVWRGVSTVAITEWGVPPAIAGMVVILIGMAIGLWHGFLITGQASAVHSDVVHYAHSARAFARYVSEQTMGFGNGFPGVRALGDGFLLGIPSPVVILALVAIVAAFFMHFTVYGRYLYAIGRNPRAAEYSGVKVGRMQTISYVACGGLAALAGILYASYTNSVQPASTGLMYELYAIDEAVLGGCSLNGGQGTIIGILVAPRLCA